MIDRGTFSQIFGEDAVCFVDVVEPILPKLTGLTIDWPDAEYDQLLQSDPDEAQKQYWIELLGRAYIAAAGTIVRQWHWIDGVCSSYERAAYLAFAGSLRGFLEATADSVHALGGAPMTLAALSSHIVSVLNDEKPRTLVTSKELEQALIHFAYAKKTRRSDPHPEGHRALQTREYVNVIKAANPELETLYCELCELVHPASNSVLWMLDSEPGAPWKVKFVGDQRARFLVEEMVNQNKEELLDLLQMGINAALATLKALRFFGLAEMKLEFVDSLNLSGVPLWVNAEAEMRRQMGGQ